MTEQWLKRRIFEKYPHLRFAKGHGWPPDASPEADSVGLIVVRSPNDIDHVALFDVGFRDEALALLPIIAPERRCEHRGALCFAVLQ